MNLKIEVVYKNNKGEVIDKNDLPKGERIRSLIQDKYGFQYKTRKSKNSSVRVYYGEPLKKEEPFHFSEDFQFIKIENDKYCLNFNKKNNTAEISSIIPPILSKGYVSGRTTHLKTVLIPIEDVLSVKEDKNLFNILVESN